MISTLAVKETAKEAWYGIKTMRVGVDCVRKANAQRVRKEYEAIKFHDSESVDDFALRLNAMVNQLAVLGDPEPEEKVVEKFLRVAPERYTQLVLSIETLLDLSTLSIEEVTGRLRTVEDRRPAKGGESGGKLLLTEEEWAARVKERQGESSTGGNKSGDRRRRAPRRRTNTSDASDGKETSAQDVSKDKCCNYGKIGHWARNC